MTESGSSPVRKAPAEKTAAKKAAPGTAAKKTVAKKAAPGTAAKKTVAKKAAPGTAAKKTVAKKAAPGTATKKTVAKKAAPGTATKKTVAKKAAPGTATKKTVAKKSPANQRGSRINAARELARSAPMSRYFTNARARARKMLDDPEALRRVADESYRSGVSRSGPFAGVMDDFRALVRLVVAYARGNYRDIPPDSLALVVAGLLYVVSPLDLVPDALPVIGFMDDAVVVGWVIKSVRQELDAFRAWEIGQ